MTWNLDRPSKGGRSKDRSSRDARKELQDAILFYAGIAHDIRASGVIFNIVFGPLGGWLLVMTFHRAQAGSG